MRKTILLPLIVAVACGIAGAQFHVHGYAGCGNQVYFEDGAGNVTTISVGNSASWGMVMDRTNSLLLVQNQDGWIYQVDPATQTVVGSLRGIASWGDIAVGQNGNYFITTTAGLFMLDSSNAINTVVAGLNGLVGGMDIDIDTGDLLIQTSARGPDHLLRISRDGSSVVTLATGGEARFGMAQHIPTGDVYASSCCTGGSQPRNLVVYRRGVPGAQIWLGGALPRGVESLKVDRASAAKQRLILGAQWGGITGGFYTVDIATKAVTRLSTINTSMYETEILYRRNLHSNSTVRGVWSLGIRIPGDAGLSYTLGMTASGVRPGIRLADGRTIHLVPDALTTLGLTVGLAPYLTGTSGALDASGRAAAKLDLSSLGPGANGVLLHFAVVTFDRSAPLGIKTVCDPHVIRVEGL